MSSKIQRFKDTSAKPGPFDQNYVPINIKTDNITGAITLSIEGTGTVIVGTDLIQAVQRLQLAYKSDIDKSNLITKTTEHSYGF